MCLVAGIQASPKRFTQHLTRFTLFRVSLGPVRLHAWATSITLLDSAQQGLSTSRPRLATKKKINIYNDDSSHCQR